MSRREYISKSVRFAVLSRDGFRCRYCGAAPPEVVLHLDHVVAVAKGGGNEAENLVTACLPCNLGKGVETVDLPSYAPRTAGAAPARPRIEFFWLHDLEDARRPRRLIDARCVEAPDWSLPAHEREWRSAEYFRLCDARHPGHYMTHGASGIGFSPYEAAMYAAELVHSQWRDMGRYIGFIDDLILMRSAGHLPAYCAPFVLRALHPETMHARCDRLDSDYEEIGDNLAKQAAAAFKGFIEREHAPWQVRT